MNRTELEPCRWHGSDYANRLLSAMRKQFRGHDEKKEGR